MQLFLYSLLAFAPILTAFFLLVVANRPIARSRLDFSDYQKIGFKTPSLPQAGLLLLKADFKTRKGGMRKLIVSLPRKTRERFNSLQSVGGIDQFPLHLGSFLNN